jgi:hypothetical protein
MIFETELNRKLVIKMKFDEFDLLELFEAEPIIVHGDEQAGVFMYLKKDYNGANIVFLFDVYQCYCEFSINLESDKSTLCEYRVNNVASLDRIEDSLRLVSKENNEIVRIDFKPTISVGIVEL